MDPSVHAENSAEKFGGKIEDYLAIHEFLDSARGAVGTTVHRIFTHNTWFIDQVLPRVFGNSITNSDGAKVLVRDIGTQHVGEDYGKENLVPTLGDMLSLVDTNDIPPWFDNGLRDHRGDSAYPPSLRRRKKKRKTRESEEGEVREVIKKVPMPIPYRPLKYD